MRETYKHEEMMGKFLVFGVFVIFCLVKVEMTPDKEIEDLFEQEDTSEDAVSRLEEKALEWEEKRETQTADEYEGPYESGVQRFDKCNRRCVTTGTWSKTETCYRQRKEFTSMTYEERVRYIKVIKKASSDPHYKPRYDALITIHKKLFNTSIHLSTDFLPWHRWYILQYENLMREIDCRFTASYWDWSLVAEKPFLSDLWKDGPDGFGGNGTSCNRDSNGGGGGKYSRDLFRGRRSLGRRRHRARRRRTHGRRTHGGNTHGGNTHGINTHGSNTRGGNANGGSTNGGKPTCGDNHGAPMYNANCVTTGPFKQGEFNVVPYAGGGCLTRNFNSSLTTPNAIAVRLLILENPAVRFMEFERALREEMHDEVHCVIGGIMCDEQSAAAPEFFLHHTFVDKIWDDYQKQSFEHHAPHHLTSQKGKMEASQYETTDFLDLEHQPGCVSVEYLPPKSAVFKLLQALTKEQLMRIETVPMPEVSEQSRILFGITTSQIDRLNNAETFFKSKNIIHKSELSGIDAIFGFKLGDLEREADQSLADVEEQMKREEIMGANGKYF